MHAALFLDFDGVILRNHPAHKNIANNCINYVNRYVPFYNPLKAQELNKYLYTTYGHTLIGLQAINTPASVREFNTLVYDSFPYTKYFKDIKQTHAKDIHTIQKLLAECESNHIPVHVFSNSPDEWCHTIMHMMGLPLLQSTSTICGERLKPDLLCYGNIEKAYPGYNKYIFVDDTFINFKNIMDNPKWVKVCMTNEYQTNTISLREDFFMICDIKGASDVISHIRSVP